MKFKLNNVVYPNCSIDCAIIKHLGVGECESVCPHKFDSNGEPYKVLELNKKEP